MVDISTWRARIGTHKVPHGYRQMDTVSAYEGTCQWTAREDLSYRLVCFTFVLCVIFSAGTALVSAGSYIYQFQADRLGNTRSEDMTLIGKSLLWYPLTGQSDIAYFEHAHITNSSPINNKLLNPIAYSVWLIELCKCGDVEKNPGPPTNQQGDFQETILLELRQIRNDMIRDSAERKKEMKTVLETLGEVKDSLRNIKDNQEILRLDVDSLTDKVMTLEDTQLNVKEIQDEMDKLEAYSRRDNLIFYGLPEMEEDSFAHCKTLILETLASVLPDTQCSSRDIVRAHRLGKKSSNKIRPVICKFLHWDDKMCVLQNRKEFKERGIGVANDLTFRQREKLRQLKSEGKSGYFKGGRLVTEDPVREPPANVSSRTGGIRTVAGRKRDKENNEPDGHTV